MSIPLPDSWQQWLGAEFEAPYMQALRDFLAGEKAARKVIYPHSSNWFRAFELTPLEEVRVVILGQDPYHGPNQAHGLCFSVRPGVQVPPSLVNIYKELAADVGFQPVNHGFLESWARQGVLLLNTSLTVEQGNAGSHRGRGWETFTDRAIATVNEHAGPTVFLLWGSHARKKKALVDTSRHLVLESPHPSPLSAHRGFFGNRHFSRANAFLAEQGRTPIDWQLPQQP
ncbi:uracil-DNA glycosylase [Halomonas elongata]|uniref:Uracil-DNA glycosylase n=1 Tax=Halomonas elongata (strain ATCC 33173 / DSM 2581 / NBRC 15536 / NCIMB 2198 / 1H9) TaxID=768066 RepID=E1V4D8_HALED|nr:uracil-DNA glycosylase [Halomonas elongata]MBW5799707.1 uracil-DNA glycosylase [Halomonas elongata]MDL4861620.1 uracil-DNA glycosylase [Halomonas elongata]RAW07001.1 uracil-DNA glycosylase [Halomonas elongata]WBF16621.1 uracil-DNA glycosylase [Halomonas elongata]WPU49062.1 uracil-DNA glycosylase [Halomonas elongata DSM 2581]